MSDNGSDEVEEEIMFKCKHCPGTSFNAREKDEHRGWHREQQKGRRRPSRSRMNIPEGAASEATTMFTAAPAEPVAGGSRQVSRKKPSKTPKATPKKTPRKSRRTKIKPVHHFDQSVESERKHGA